LYHGGLFTEGAEANGNPIRALYEGNAADPRAVTAPCSEVGPPNIVWTH
jgi:hypothetical protein